MNRTLFYAKVRRVFGGHLSQTQVAGIEALLTATEGLPVPHRAYIMATAMHETASTMQPIREYGKGKGRPYGKPGKYGQGQYGRGYVQLTWDANYERADKELGLNGALLKDFDMALRVDIAAQILVRGMSEGWFTGKKLSDYMPDYRAARRIVNGTDKAELIAGYAAGFEAALMEGLVNPPEPPQETPAPVPPPIPAQTPASRPTGLFGALAGILAALFRSNNKGNQP